MEFKAWQILASGRDQAEQVLQLKALADDAAESGDAADGLAALICVLARDEVPSVVGRPALEHAADVVAATSEALGPEGVKRVAAQALEAIGERRALFVEADAVLREAYGKALAESEMYIEAARVLAGIDLESGRYSDSQKAEQYVRITELFLEEDETVEAERFVNRASQYVFSCQDPLVQVRHKVSYARILDSKRKFLDAAHRYYQLSTESLEIDGKLVAEDDLLHLLVKAVTCALLASAGPQRTRMLNLLYKDERTRNFSTHWPVLEKMFMERFLSKAEVKAFEQTLDAHQKAILADGSSVLERAVIEHNLLAASKIYSNISLPELAKILDTDAEKAELIAYRMVAEDRLGASIDQVDFCLDFAPAGEALAGFDARIQELCLSVNGALDTIEKRHPAFALDALAHR